LLTPEQKLPEARNNVSRKSHPQYGTERGIEELPVRECQALEEGRAEVGWSGQDRTLNQPWVHFVVSLREIMSLLCLSGFYSLGKGNSHRTVLWKAKPKCVQI
jgi:hypothetical protein